MLTENWKSIMGRNGKGKLEMEWSILAEGMRKAPVRREG